MKSNFLIIPCLLINMLLSNNISSQDFKTESMPDSLENNPKLRKAFVYSSIGILEYFSIGIGYQFSNKLSISLDGSASFIGGGFIFPNDAMGIGTRVSYYIPFLIFNSINFESIVLLHQDIQKQTTSFIKGYFLDINIGRETIYKNGLNVFWGVGICGNNAHDVPGRFLYSLKIGLNFNFY